MSSSHPNEISHLCRSHEDRPCPNHWYHVVTHSLTTNLFDSISQQASSLHARMLPQDATVRSVDPQEHPATNVILGRSSAQLWSNRCSWSERRYSSASAEFLPGWLIHSAFLPLIVDSDLKIKIDGTFAKIFEVFYSSKTLFSSHSRILIINICRNKY